MGLRERFDGLFRSAVKLHQVEYYDPQTNNQGRLVHLRRQAYFLIAHAIQIPSFYSYQIFLGLAHIKKVNWGFL